MKPRYCVVAVANTGIRARCGHLHLRKEAAFHCREKLSSESVYARVWCTQDTPSPLLIWLDREVEVYVYRVGVNGTMSPRPVREPDWVKPTIQQFCSQLRRETQAQSQPKSIETPVPTTSNLLTMPCSGQQM